MEIGLNHGVVEFLLSLRIVCNIVACPFIPGAGLATASLSHVFVFYSSDWVSILEMSDPKLELYARNVVCSLGMGKVIL